MATCEWVIDIIQEWVQDQGYLTSSFIDRGDPAASDFNLAFFVEDAAWHNLDLSAIVPAGAKAVVFLLYLDNAIINKTAKFRKAGNANEPNSSQARTQVANIVINNDLTCPISTDRHIEYNFSAGGWNNIFMTVKGWWL